MGLLDSAARIELDLSNIPIILTYSHPHSDFAIFAGWNDTQLGELSTMSVSQLEILAKRWIQSAQEKVDVWSVSIKLHEVTALLLRKAGWRSRSARALKPYRRIPSSRSASCPMSVSDTTPVSPRATTKSATNPNAKPSTASSTDGKASRTSAASSPPTCAPLPASSTSTTSTKREKHSRYSSTSGNTKARRSRKWRRAVSFALTRASLACW